MVSIEMDGRILFTLREPAAEIIELVGAFEGWHEQRLPMHRDAEGTWRLAIDPGPGEYLFRYLVDDTRWRLDPYAHGCCLAADGVRKSRVWRPPLRLDPDAIAA